MNKKLLFLTVASNPNMVSFFGLFNSKSCVLLFKPVATILTLFPFTSKSIDGLSASRPLIRSSGIP